MRGSYTRDIARAAGVSVRTARRYLAERYPRHYRYSWHRGEEASDAEKASIIDDLRLGRLACPSKPRRDAPRRAGVAQLSLFG